MLPTGMHIALLYLWQIKALRADSLEPAAKWVGIFRVDTSSSADRLGPQVGCGLQLPHEAQMDTALRWQGTGRSDRKKSDLPVKRSIEQSSLQICIASCFPCVHCAMK